MIVKVKYTFAPDTIIGKPWKHLLTCQKVCYKIFPTVQRVVYGFKVSKRNTHTTCWSRDMRKFCC